MKNFLLLKLSITALIIGMIFSCQKDEFDSSIIPQGILNSPTSSEYVVQRFFDFNNITPHIAANAQNQLRDSSSLLDDIPTLIVRANNELVAQNETTAYVPLFVARYGFPYWAYSHYVENLTGQNGYISLPFSKDSDTTISGILFGFYDEAQFDHMKFRFVSRENMDSLLQLQTPEIDPNLHAYLLRFTMFDEALHGTTDPTYSAAYCNYFIGQDGPELNDDSNQLRNGDCDIIVVKECYWADAPSEVYTGFSGGSNEDLGNGGGFGSGNPILVGGSGYDGNGGAFSDFYKGIGNGLGDFGEWVGGLGDWAGGVWSDFWDWIEWMIDEVECPDFDPANGDISTRSKVWVCVDVYYEDCEGDGVNWWDEPLDCPCQYGIGGDEEGKIEFPFECVLVGNKLVKKYKLDLSWRNLYALFRDSCSCKLDEMTYETCIIDQVFFKANDGLNLDDNEICLKANPEVLFEIWKMKNTEQPEDACDTSKTFDDIIDEVLTPCPTSMSLDDFHDAIDDKIDRVTPKDLEACPKMNCVYDKMKNVGLCEEILQGYTEWDPYFNLDIIYDKDARDTSLNYNPDGSFSGEKADYANTANSITGRSIQTYNKHFCDLSPLQMMSYMLHEMLHSEFLLWYYESGNPPINDIDLKSKSPLWRAAVNDRYGDTTHPVNHHKLMKFFADQMAEDLWKMNGETDTSRIDHYRWFAYDLFTPTDSMLISDGFLTQSQMDNYKSLNNQLSSNTGCE